jgi:hypothetical protein
MRGRVGRSNKKAYCFLATPSLASLTSDARKRLSALEEFADLGDGIKVAMRDLDIRGAGNLLGGEQSGFINDLGYDMYHKILDEAVQELKENEFKSLFENAIDRVKNDWKQIGILGENDKPISKSLFTKLADIHIFGYGTRAMKVWYFSNGRGSIYGFYPMQGTKIENQKECYEYYLDILNGKCEHLDERSVCFGNSGYPLSYTRLRIS